jgi:hypothetical protein
MAQPTQNIAPAFLNLRLVIADGIDASKQLRGGPMSLRHVLSNTPTATHIWEALQTLEVLSALLKPISQEANRWRRLSAGLMPSTR